MNMLEKEDKKIHKKLPENINRRNFLTFFIFGGLAFLSGKVLNNLIGSPMTNNMSSKIKKEMSDFNIKETNDGLALNDKDGNEILIIHNT